MQNIDYSKQETPTDYICDECGAAACKLWREYQKLSPRLLCAKCAAKNQKVSIDGIDTDGKHPLAQDGQVYKTDQIGDFVPAVPDTEGFGYWGYSSVPREGVNWWRHLPTLPD